MSSGSSDSGATGEVLLDARFDRRVISYLRLLTTGFLFITVAGILLIPFWLIFSLWYLPELYRRQAARLTARAVEIRKGVFFRKEATIPLNRITDVRLHDGPLMRFFGLRGAAGGDRGPVGPERQQRGRLGGSGGGRGATRRHSAPTRDGARRGSRLPRPPRRRPARTRRPSCWPRFATSSPASNARAADKALA